MTDMLDDIRAADAALGPGSGNLDTDTADRRLLLRMYDQDIAELDAENAELRRALADTPTTEAAIAKLREWVPDYEVDEAGMGASYVAMPVATARRLLDELDRLRSIEEHDRAAAQRVAAEGPIR